MFQSSNLSVVKGTKKKWYQKGVILHSVKDKIVSLLCTMKRCLLSISLVFIYIMKSATLYAAIIEVALCDDLAKMAA